MSFEETVATIAFGVLVLAYVAIGYAVIAIRVKQLVTKPPPMPEPWARRYGK